MCIGDNLDQLFSRYPQMNVQGSWNGWVSLNHTTICGQRRWRASVGASNQSAPLSKSQMQQATSASCSLIPQKKTIGGTEEVTVSLANGKQMDADVVAVLFF